MAAQTEPTSRQAAAAGQPGRTGLLAEARLRAWLLGAFFILGPLALLYFYYRARFVGLVNADALDFAQIARNLSGGQGFSTSVLRPLALGTGDAPAALPDVNHGPLFPLLLAIAYGAAGARDTVTAGVSALFYLLTIPAVFLLGKRIFGRRVGLVSALIFTVNSLTLEYALSGLNLTLCIFLVTLLFHALYSVTASGDEGAAQAPRGALLRAGALTALLYLAEPDFAWLIPVAALAVWTSVRPYRARGMVLFIVPLVVLAAPWMARNARLAGDPVFALRSREAVMYTQDVYPGLSAYRRSPGELGAAPGLPAAIVRKALTAAGAILDTWPRIAANWALAFFLPSLLFRFSDQAATRLRRFLLWALGAMCLGQVLIRLQMPLFVALVPVMLTYAVAYLLFLVQQAQLARPGRMTLTAALGAALAYPVAVELTLRAAPGQPVGKVTSQVLAGAGKPTDVVLTSQPFVVAWYGKKRAMLLPATADGISAMRKRFPDARWLVLTPEVVTWSSEWELAYTALERWSTAWTVAARTEGAKPPGLIQFRGPQPPLMGALAGFTSVPPVEAVVPSTRPTVVAALLPAAGGEKGGAR